MELFGSRPDSPKEECLGLVRKSNIFISILGMRHGSVDQSTGKSITELEYEEAIALKLPCLIYLMDEDEHLVPPRSVEQGEGSEKLRKLKNLLRQRHVISKFSSASDLAAKVAKDLVQTVGAREQAPTATVLVS
jgi:SpoVK/Ycf46/Vps4 family AAA+-type ATPase